MSGSGLGDEGGGVTGEDAQGVGGGGALQKVGTHARFYALEPIVNSGGRDTRTVRNSSRQELEPSPAENFAFNARKLTGGTSLLTSPP